MAEPVTVARPYAEAAFKVAVEGNALARWSDMLQLATVIARDPLMQSTLSSPKVSLAQKKALFFAVAGEHFDEGARSLVSLLLQNGRAVLLPSVGELFEKLKNDHERVLIARITSAQPLNDAQKAEIVGSLERQYGKKIQAEVSVDPELLGGARVQVGDQVIHASVRDALAQLATALTR
jgi:F-type H+-transporting ATPase subunit delta